MKKFLIFIVCIMLVSLLASCSNSKYDLSLAKVLQEENYYVDFLIESDDIEECADEFDAKDDGIDGIMIAEPEDWDDEKVGLVFFCDSTKSAKALEESLKEYIKDMDEDDYIYFKRGIVTRVDDTVFMGCEDVWEVIE